MKRIAMFLVLAGFIAGSLAAQEQFPDLFAYASNMNVGITGLGPRRREQMRNNQDLTDKIRELSGAENFTPLQWALRGYYIYDIETCPPNAEAILPHNNPRLVDRQLGAYVYKDLIVYRFLNDTAAVNRHEAMLQYITGRGNATRAEIETFYRNNIRALVSQVVDEEFNKVSFLLENYSTNSRFSYNAVLTRNNQNGQYTLNYERPSVENDDKTITAASLEALSSAMRNSGDFVPAAINTVRAQAALIPAVALSSADIQAAKNELTNFLLTPNNDTLLALRRRYRNFALTQGERSNFASTSLRNAVSSFSEGLAVRMTAN